MKRNIKGYYCPKHGLMSCPICGSDLRVLEYRGNDPKMLAIVKSRGFKFFLGCKRVVLHNKVVDGVDYRDKAYIYPIFDDNDAG